MTQHADIQPSSLEEVLEILQSEAQSLPPSPTSSRYLRALSSLKSSVMVGTHGSCVRAASQVCGKHSMSASPRVEGNHGPSSDRAAGLSPVQGACSPSEDLRLKTEDFPDTAPADTPNDNLSLIINNFSLAITDWLINQWLLQTPFSTASLYLDIISALYGSAVKKGCLPKTTLFSNLKTQLKQLGPDGWKSGIDDEIFARALRLTKNAAHLIADDAKAARLVIHSLTHGLIPLQDITLDRRGNIVDSAVPAREPSQHVDSALRAREQSRESSEHVDSALRAREQSGESSEQSETRGKGASPKLKRIVNALFRRARLPQSTDPNQTVEALWAYAALRAGIPASQVVAILGHAPLGLPVLKLSVGSYKLSESGQAANDDLVGTHGLCVRVPSDSVTEGSPCPSPRVRPASQVCGKHSMSASPRVEGNHGQSQDRAASYNLQLTTHNSNNRAAGLSQGETNSTPLNSSPLTLNTYEEYFASIGKIFLDNPPRWYAMSLRPGVRFTSLTARLDLLYSHKSNSYNLQLTTYNSAPPELFYPCEEIARAIGKKIVIKKRPFIHSVVFFKAKLTDIGRLFAKIGDLAWCYRQSAAPGAPYAEISETQFRQFQQTISSFTPDYEVAASGELELKKNDRVEILGGLFAGHTATFEKSEESRVKSEGPHTIYRLNIVGDNGIEWRIGIDKRLVMESGHLDR